LAARPRLTPIPELAFRDIRAHIDVHLAFFGVL
jgi:hypothetical protein